MNSSDICWLSFGDLGRLVQKKELSPVQITEAFLSKIEQSEPQMNSFITVSHNQAMTEAREAEQEIVKGNYRGKLHGIPFGLKDLFRAKGVRYTRGSTIFDQEISKTDSTIASRMKKAGAILLGKQNMNPLAYGPIGEDRKYDYGHMHNPWDPGLISGGSSGGSGSSVGSGECPLSIGSDTGGSIRIPSAFCGIVGLKPTYGRISRNGCAALSWSLDHPGPMARTVEDCAIAMNTLAGFDPQDPSSSKVRVPDFTSGLKEGVKNLKIGVPREYLLLPIDPEVREAFTNALKELEILGAEIREISWPMHQYAETISNIILLVEASAAYRKLVIEKGTGMFLPLRMRLEAGLFISAADFLEAQQARTLFNRKSFELFDQVDLLAGPTLPITACPIGTKQVVANDIQMGVVTAMTQFNTAFNLNGFPAITLPCGFSDDGLPIALQLAGRPFDEETVLKTAYTYEKATPWHQKRPNSDEPVGTRYQ